MRLLVGLELIEIIGHDLFIYLGNVKLNLKLIFKLLFKYLVPIESKCIYFKKPYSNRENLAILYNYLFIFMFEIFLIFNFYAMQYDLTFPALSFCF